MELLIPGLILVALMVYASTKIKKAAASAFEPEQIETDDISISKPDGMLSRVDPDPPFLFEAYSKELGEKPFEKVRRVTADIRPVASIDSAANEIRNYAERILDDRQTADGRVIEAEETFDEAAVRTFYKLVKKDGRVLRLRVGALKEPSDESLRKIEEMLESFTAK